MKLPEIISLLTQIDSQPITHRKGNTANLTKPRTIFSLLQSWVKHHFVMYLYALSQTFLTHFQSSNNTYRQQKPTIFIHNSDKTTTFENKSTLYIF